MELEEDSDSKQNIDRIDYLDFHMNDNPINVDLSMLEDNENDSMHPLKNPNPSIKLE